ncbi:hypothetical protein Pcinc_000127 [Petrolisthes cinctipes]|uniref:Myb-like domain-containing protein n=1 Tax=Petrolisthes cinctipes TaxID=88211 RepID=A0AAE1GNW6_PETCI|nr:hypothetical protein Pcinc_000127 [Petrolisthes cinctipes]
MAWETIATKLQQAFPAGKRTVKECQKRWHTILTSSRPKLAKVNGDFTATGGGPPHPPLDPLDELVADILDKENVSIKGIVEALGLHTNPPEESSISNPFEDLAEEEFLLRFRLSKECVLNLLQNITEQLPIAADARGTVPVMESV